MKTFSTPITLSLLAIGALGTSACLDPQVSDDIIRDGLILPAGTEVPSGHDADTDRQIADNDGIDGIAPLLSGFAGGAPTNYWDFGISPSYGAPLFALAKRNDDGALEMLSHNPIFDAIPGDSGYSPYWTVLLLEVTNLYNGELITSFAAVEEAQRRGLVLAPSEPTFAANCPVVSKDASIAVGEGLDPLPPLSLAYWQGKTVFYYDFGQMPIPDADSVPEANVLVISREGKEPISEPLRLVDITNDGDIADTNNVFEQARADDGYSPLTRRVDVTVPDDGFPLVDTTQDQQMSGLQTYSDLFTPQPVPGRVVAFDRTDELRNLPQQSEVGGL
tara:strand:- start:72868 stop:73866 length:999 start_codon:yes stop_codon:yes gene_type:complete